MSTVTICFYGNLNDFLPAAQRQAEITYSLDGPASVKHPIEALGIPHPEVDQIVANGQAVGFDYRLRACDRVGVYPMGRSDHAVARVQLRPSLPRPVVFIVDTHLGQLATYLRLLGFDTLYRNDYNDSELALTSSREGRLLLTRDRGLLKRKVVVHGYCVRGSEPRRQLVSVLRRYALAAEISAWQRCVHCNGRLAPVDKAEVWDQLEPLTKRYYDSFRRCCGCGHVYWEGSHFERMRDFVAGVSAEANASS